MLATVFSSALQGIDAELVHVEVNAGETGEPHLILVGLPDAAVKESQDRVTSALQNSGFRSPRTRTTINLAPGHVRKEGPCYDLPIALGLLGGGTTSRALVKSPSPTTACCSWTNCPNSNAAPSKSCANRWKTAS